MTKRKTKPSNQQAPKKQKAPPTTTKPQKIVCVLSEDGDDPFDISFTSDFTIQALKDAIHQKQFHKLKHLAPENLKLYLIVLGEDDGTTRDVEGKRNVPECNTKMRPRDTLTYHIGNKSLDKVYVFVEFQPPAPPARPPPLTVNCWVEGDDSPFPLDIASDKTIGHLKKAILVEKPSLSIIDSDQLQLFFADIPDTKAKRDAFVYNDDKVLSATRKITKAFESGLREEHIHIVIKRPSPSLVNHGYSNLPTLDQWIIDRDETIRTICKLLLDKRVVQVRGTPGSGKTTLGDLAYRFLLKKPELRVVYIKTWGGGPTRGRDRLTLEAKSAGFNRVVNHWTFFSTATDGNDLVFIIDDAHHTYSDLDLWQVIKNQAHRSFPKQKVLSDSLSDSLSDPKTIEEELDSRGSGPRFLLLSGYGSPSQFPEEIQQNAAPIAIELDQQVSLWPRMTPYSPIPLSLSYTKEEGYAAMDAVGCTIIKGLVLADEVKEVIMELTNGHCGGVRALVQAICEQQDVRKLRREGKIVTMFYAYDFFTDTGKMLAAIQPTAYRRGVPHLRDLQQDSAVAKVMAEALEKGYIGWDYLLSDLDHPNPGLNKAFRRGWLQADLDKKQSKRYYFPSRLHLLNCEYLLGNLCVEEFPSQYQSLEEFCIEVIRRFSKNSLVSSSQGEGGPGELRKPKESHYQMEFYKAVSELLDRKCFVSSEWTGRSNKKGRVDFFIPKKKWAIELLADFDRLDEHLNRFLPGPGPEGKYHSWIRSNEVTDYIVINLTHEMKKKSVRNGPRPNFPKLLHAVFTDESYQYCALHNNLMQPLPGSNGHFALGN